LAESLNKLKKLKILNLFDCIIQDLELSEIHLSGIQSNLIINPNKIKVLTISLCPLQKIKLSDFAQIQRISCDYEWA